MAFSLLHWQSVSNSEQLCRKSYKFCNFCSISSEPEHIPPSLTSSREHVLALVFAEISGLPLSTTKIKFYSECATSEINLHIISYSKYSIIFGYWHTWAGATSFCATLFNEIISAFIVANERTPRFFIFTVSAYWDMCRPFEFIFYLYFF